MKRKDNRGPVNEAKEVEEGNRWDDVKIYLQSKPAFSSRVEVNECIAISDKGSQYKFIPSRELKKSYLSVAPTPLSAAS